MSEPSEYVPPKVWTWNKESGGRFAAINRPIAGPTHEAELPVGRHPFQLYSLATPNGVKVTVMFEELLAAGHSGAEYDAWLIKIDGNQFGSGFVAVNPNSKIPALMDRSGPVPIRVFESGAILVHLAEKFGALLPAGGQARGEFLDVESYKNVQRWTDAIAKRPGVKRGRMVNRTWGDPASQLHERHDASDFDTRTQDKIGEATASS